jgi:hypothetical protein
MAASLLLRAISGSARLAPLLSMPAEARGATTSRSYVSFPQGAWRGVRLRCRRLTGRGWRIDKGARDAQIDAAVALAMAVDRATADQPEPARLLGWL